MILRQIHVGRMRYAPTLPTEKAIPNDRFRGKAFRHFSDLSATPDESPPNHRIPIRHTRRKPSAIPSTYPPHPTKVLGDSVGLSATPDDSPQQFLRPIGRSGYSL